MSQTRSPAARSGRCGAGRAPIARVDTAAGADADSVIRPVEPAVIDARGHNVLDALAGYGLWGQAADQQPRDGGVAVREMERVRPAIGITGRGVAHLRGGAGIEI